MQQLGNALAKTWEAQQVALAQEQLTAGLVEHDARVEA